MGRGGGMRGIDEHAQRALNAQAPQIENLGGRVLKLFAPYKAKIVATCLIVVVSAALGVIPPLLVQRIFDQALFPVDGDASISLLIRLVVVMIGLYLLSAALDVVQTWLTSTVGNTVTGDLRVRLFEHLQAMELGFFTRTKTGVIQSRLQNDVGGVSGVLTNTVTSILGNVVTVIASLVAMILIDWRLTIIAVIVMPILVIVQRRVGQVRARIAGQTQESLSELTSITQETLTRLRHPAVEVVQPAAHGVGALPGGERQPGAPAGAPGHERAGLLRGRPGAHGDASRRSSTWSRASSSSAATPASPPARSWRSPPCRRVC